MANNDKIILEWDAAEGGYHDVAGRMFPAAEVWEELDLHVAVVRPLPPVSHDYPDFSVTLYPFVCSVVSGEITLHEHKALLWLSPPELWSLDWVAADFPIISAYCDRLDKYSS